MSTHTHGRFKGTTACGRHLVGLRMGVTPTCPECLAAEARPKLSQGLKPGEVALVGWQYAPYKIPAGWAELVARMECNAAKEVKRNRYMKRHNPHLMSA